MQRVVLPALADGAGLFLVMNTRAGESVIRLDPRPALSERLPAAVIHELEPGVDLDEVVREAMASESPPAVLGVFGGDGSVSRMAHLARQFDVPLFALPGGTFNHFVRAVGVENVDAAIDALRTGSGAAVSVIELRTADGEQTVLNVASAGIYPQFVARRAKPTASRFGKWIGGAAALWGILQHAQPIVIHLDGRAVRVWSVFVGAGRHRLDRIAMMQRDTLSDDVLDVRMVRDSASRTRAAGALSFGAASTRLLRALRLFPGSADVERVVSTTVDIELTSGQRGATFIVCDGELQRRPRPDAQGRIVLSCRAVPSALRVYAPV